MMNYEKIIGGITETLNALAEDVKDRISHLEYIANNFENMEKNVRKEVSEGLDKINKRLEFLEGDLLGDLVLVSDFENDSHLESCWRFLLENGYSYAPRPSEDKSKKITLIGNSSNYNMIHFDCSGQWIICEVICAIPSIPARRISFALKKDSELQIKRALEFLNHL
jgi:hypothetical protein